MLESGLETIKGLLQLVVPLCAQVANGVIGAEPWLRAELSMYGVTALMQTILLLGLTSVLIWGTVTRFGGIVRAVVLPALLMIAVHIVVPIFLA
jgi:hypothetical protein